MIKTDQSIHNICIAAIKRHTTQPYDFKWTRFYADKDAFIHHYPQMIPDLSEKEWPICSTIIDAYSWSVLTTRRLLTNQQGQLTMANIDTSISQSHGDFKGDDKKDRTLGILQLANGTRMTYFIETGKASMVMIYGIRTRINITKQEAFSGQ